jgi:hypothetical protein
MKKKSKIKVVKSAQGNVCSGSCCPFYNPFSLAAFLVGFLVVFYTKPPYQWLGWATVALAYAVPTIKVAFNRLKS